MCVVRNLFTISVVCVLVVFCTEENGRVLKKHSYYNISQPDIFLAWANIHEIELEAFKDISVESLRLYGNSLEGLKKGIFVNVSIHELDISENKITTIEARTFHDLHPIDHYGILQLSLSRNALAEIKKGIFNQTKFRKLNLSYNKIKYIEPGSFEGMIHLLEIDLERNLLEKIDVGVFQNLNVPTAWVQLYFKANQIKFVDPYAFENTTVYSLDLQDNNLKPLDNSYFKKTSIGNILM